MAAELNSFLSITHLEDIYNLSPQVAYDLNEMSHFSLFHTSMMAMASLYARYMGTDTCSSRDLSS